VIASVRSLEEISLDGHRLSPCRGKHYEGSAMGSCSS
jgi:hypothetical protein